MKVLGETKVAGARASRLSSAVVLLALAAAASLTAWIADLGAPLPPDARRPLSFAAAAHYPGSLGLSQDHSAAELLCSLRSPMHASEFLTHNAHRIRHTSPLPYALRFRLTLAELQRVGWEGDCNDYANAICEIGYHHGYPMYIVSMWPERWSHRLRDDWHQIAVLCLQPNREYLIFDYETPVHWHGTLDEYAKRGRKVILPVGGTLEWRPTKANPVARFLDHLRSNSQPPANQKPLEHTRSDSMA